MCDERERLIGYVYDECAPLERNAIEAHLEECGTCRAEIGGLRDVRQDLLAWAVPPHEAVWRPFVAAPVTPWWRQVPAWAMAAAAGVMFLVGAAGGVVTHAVVPHDQAGSGVTAASTPVQMVSAAVTESQLSEVEQRIVQMMRGELSKREAVARGSAGPGIMPASLDANLTPRRLDELIGASEQRQWEIVAGVQREWYGQMNALKRELNGLKEAVALAQQGGGR